MKFKHPIRLHPGSPGYPRGLYELSQPPTITLSRPLLSTRVIAIVGARAATVQSRGLAFSLAYHLARAGITIVSGGAVGVDRAAHEGALHADGATWAVQPLGFDRLSPPENADVFERIHASELSSILWPFPDGTEKDNETPRQRNGTLVALAECVVVIQAKDRSGSRNACSWTRDLDRPLWVVPGGLNDELFAGSMEEGANGANAFWSIQSFFQKLNLPPPDISDERAKYCDIMPLPTRIRKRRQLRLTYGNPAPAEVDPKEWTENERTVFSVLSLAPTQQDRIISQARLSASSTLTALLTLSLKDVVVEGPDGFFRRRVSS